VAIVQISRITQRKGLLVDLPQPLAGGELGWAVDERRLFIGNGDLADGAPVIGNTEVLTEFSDVLSFANQYIYQGQAAGYAVQTGATSSAPASQSIQSRLDSYAVITDFGATGDGVTDVTADINRALFQMFCREINPQIRRSLFFPAGVYIISDTILIPPFCTLYGEGAKSTIIKFQVQPWTNTVSFAQGVLVENGGNYFRSLVPVPIGEALPTPPASNTYWASTTLSTYMARTTDSLQQTGVNIGTNGALTPGNLRISGMQFESDETNNGLLVEYAENCFVDAVTIKGPQTTASISIAPVAATGVNLLSSATLVSKNITFNNCHFTGFSQGAVSDNQIENVTFSNCAFDTLFQGVVLGGSPPVAGGPTGTRIVQSLFDQIAAQGITFINASRNISAYNTFYDVGNGFLGDAFPQTVIIDLDANKNVSVGDVFERSNASADVFARIDTNTSDAIVLGENQRFVELYQNNVLDTTRNNMLQLGNYKRIAGISDVINDDSALGTLAVVKADSNEIPAFVFEYTIIRANKVRTGRITVVTGQIGTAGTGFSWVDDYVDNGNTAVTLEAVHNGDTSNPEISINYTANGSGDGAIRYSISHLN
jgi:hypothetical protein